MTTCIECILYASSIRKKSDIVNRKYRGKRHKVQKNEIIKSAKTSKISKHHQVKKTLQSKKITQ